MAKKTFLKGAVILGVAGIIIKVLGAFSASRSQIS